MTIKVDLRLRVLSRDHGAYLARPGAQYALYSDFAESFAIGPEFPGIELAPGVPILKQRSIDNKIKLAREVIDWANSGKPDDKIPSKNPDDHRKRGKSSGWPQYTNALQGYFEKAQLGDLVLIPPRSFSDDAIVGEFSGGPEDIVYVRTTRYRDFQIPARRFRVLARIKKKDLPLDLIDLIEKPNMFVALGRTHKQFLYHHAYANYFSEGDYSSKIEIRSADYSTIDDVTLLAFINFIANNTRVVTYERDAGILSFRDAVFASLGEYAPALRTNINSPGSLTLRASFITPLVVVAMLALAAYAGPQAVEAAQAGQIVIGNSLAPAGDPCTAVVSEAVLTQLQLDGLATEWPEACERARKAIRDTDLVVSPQVTETKDEQ